MGPAPPAGLLGGLGARKLYRKRDRERFSTGTDVSPPDYQVGNRLAYRGADHDPLLLKRGGHVDVVAAGHAAYDRKPVGGDGDEGTMFARRRADLPATGPS